ncbi:RNA polymerase sigma factor [Prosthecobacter sp.]|uniref:RNA polymerase sigma factor n=1 Tax=Prosthecobacter sp. TaxID=1965333 RepID=UPI0037852B84
MSYAEIAAAVGCSSKAVETRIYRARQILRAALGGSQGGLTLPCHEGGTAHSHVQHLRSPLHHCSTH